MRSLTNQMANTTRQRHTVREVAAPGDDTGAQAQLTTHRSRVALAVVAVLHGHKESLPKDGVRKQKRREGREGDELR